MKMVICAVYDQAVKAYMQPFFQRTEGEAIRSFIDAVNANDSHFSKHPQDFVLMKLGSYEDSNGEFYCGTTGPSPLMTAQNALNMREGV